METSVSLSAAFNSPVANKARNNFHGALFPIHFHLKIQVIINSQPPSAELLIDL